MDKTEIKKLIPNAFSDSNLKLSGKKSGKVRDWYDIDQDHRLIVTTDRLSAFDRNLACVPYKGQVLNQLSAWWFDNTKDVIPNHIVNIPDPNAALVKNAKPLKIEVIVRGYITGVTKTALWYRYALGEREIYGYTFPDDLKKNQSLAKPIITPTTKGGPSGHDERLTCSEVVNKGFLQAHDWDIIKQAAIGLFEFGQSVALKAGLILVDTKYEFGKLENGQIILIDEIHTPDSSRFWLADTYNNNFEAGIEPDNFDKEFIRLAYSKMGYIGDGKAPEMPDELWVSASERYISIYERITGKTFEPGSYPVNQRLDHNLRKAGILV